jgi:hypothetical protein
VLTNLVALPRSCLDARDPGYPDRRERGRIGARARLVKLLRPHGDVPADTSRGPHPTRTAAGRGGFAARTCILPPRRATRLTEAMPPTPDALPPRSRAVYRIPVQDEPAVPDGARLTTE